ncbi:MAG: hypothetical protein KDA91_26290, partial [Planctomycetaceae bacterium]|nr:hypothetical protein [Planctomycetaceae bacterium]
MTSWYDQNCQRTKPVSLQWTAAGRGRVRDVQGAQQSDGCLQPSDRSESEARSSPAGKKQSEFNYRQK